MCLITRLEDPGACPPQGNYSEFSGFHDLSASEAEEVPAQSVLDPLEQLDRFGDSPLTV